MAPLMGVLLTMLAVFPAQAAGLMTPANGGRALKLVEQHVDVVIQNGYATTSIEQVFSNPHAEDLEALYSFPVPKEAAVGEFSFWIDGQPVHGEVLKKRAARQLYESQKQQGQEAGLVEQDAYQTFDVTVTPVRANDSVRTRLVYLQRHALDHSIGRYVYPLEEGGVDVARDHFWHRNDAVEQAFSFDLTLRSAWPIEAVRVPRGAATVQQLDTGHWEVSIHSANGPGATLGAGLDDQALAETSVDPLVYPNEQNRTTPGSSAIATAAHTLDQDIVVYWRLVDDLPGAVEMVTYKAPNANHGTFMLTLTPGIDLQPITEGRDWVFILDMSGSMAGKYRSLLDGVRRALGSLNPADRFKIVLFDDRAHTLTRGYEPADGRTVQRMLAQLESRAPGGSTNLYDGLKQGLKGIEADRTTALVLVTDGVANVGPTALEKFLQLLETRDVRLFTAVMGNSANEPLLGALTRHAEGFAVNVSNADDMVGLMLQMTAKVTHEALHNVRVDIDGVRISGLTPERYARVYRGEQLVMLGQYRGSGEAELTVKTEISGQAKTFRSRLGFPDEDVSNPELERLWGFASIEALQEQERLTGATDDTRQAITDLAVQHGLVTEHTSLVVVRQAEFDRQGIERHNASRVVREHHARAQRAAQPVVNARQDSHAPTFNDQRHNTSNGSSGGASGWWLLVALLMIVAGRLGTHMRARIDRRGTIDRV